MKVAAIDLGSNTFLCLIAEVSKDITSTGNKCTIQNVYADEMQIVRLGQQVNETKRLHPDALTRARNCLQDFKKIIDLHQPEKILAMATSAARDAENRNELFEIGKNLNIPIEIIAGVKEAEITYQGSLAGQTENKNRLIVDIGGGSTEFIIGDLQVMTASQSIDIGCVRLTEKFITNQPTESQEMNSADNFILQRMGTLKNFSIHKIEEIIAVAGTPTSLAVAQIGHYDAASVEGYILTADALQLWKEKLQISSAEEKIKLGLPKGRADVMLIGVLILLQTLRYFKKSQLTVSTRGVRHGIALEMAHRYLS